MYQETSKIAYETVKIGKRQEEVLNILSEIEDANNQELAILLGWEINRVTPRVKELRDRGLVEESRRSICKLTGRPTIYWKVK